MLRKVLEKAMQPAEALRPMICHVMMMNPSISETHLKLSVQQARITRKVGVGYGTLSLPMKLLRLRKSVLVKRMNEEAVVMHLLLRKNQIKEWELKENAEPKKCQ